MSELLLFARSPNNASIPTRGVSGQSLNTAHKEGKGRVK